MKRCLNCMSEYPDQYEDRCPHCGYVHDVTQNGDINLPPGSILQGRYIVGTVIRARDTDVIYNGWDAMFDRRIRIQEYFPKYCATRSAKTELSIYDSKVETYEQGLEVFVTQSRELIRLYKKTDVVTYHACFRENKTAYAVTEYRNLKTMREWADGRKISGHEAMDLLFKAIKAVRECQDLGIYHGVMDLDSFWVSGNGELILKDFGAWKYVSGEPGVVGYGNYDPELDVYGLAKTFCQLLTGSDSDDEEKLQQELFRNGMHLRKCEADALKRALSHDTKTIDSLEEELLGGRRCAMLSARNKIRRRDAKLSFAMKKRWLAAAGAVVILILGITVVGVRHIRLESMSASEADQGEVRVPNLIGENTDRAESMLKDLGLGIDKDKKEFSYEIAVDKIMFQSVRAGTKVEKGTDIVVYISKGKEKKKIELDKIIGKEAEEAKQLLLEAGFESVVSELDAETQGTKGTVIKVRKESEDGETENGSEEEAKSGEQNTEGWVSRLLNLLRRKETEEERTEESNIVTGEEVLALDTKLTLVICDREEESNAEEMEVPDLIGCTYEEAEEEIEGKPFSLNRTDIYSEKPVGEIVGQRPETGMTRESVIQVDVSKGPEKVVMEDLELLTLEEAKEHIKIAGLSVGEITEECSDSIAKGKIIFQSVEEGTEVEKETVVDLVVSSGKEAKQSESSTEEKPKPKPKQQSTGTAQKKATEAASKEVEEEKAKAEAEAASKAAEAAGKAAEEASKAAEGVQQAATKEDDTADENTPEMSGVGPGGQDEGSDIKLEGPPGSTSKQEKSKNSEGETETSGMTTQQTLENPISETSQDVVSASPPVVDAEQAAPGSDSQPE